MAENKLLMEGLVTELKKVERITDGGVTTSYQAKIQARGDDGKRIEKFEDTEPLGLVEGETIQIYYTQVQKSMDEFNGPKVN